MDLSTIRHKPSEVTDKSKAKVPAGTVELVDGQFGKTCKFSFVESTGPQFFFANVRPQENWDEYDGFSFWVKGDGSKNCGGFEFVDDSYAQRYGYCFPINSTTWTKITVPWSDMVPELSSALVDAKEGFAPSKFRSAFVGKWFYWREWPACSFAIERMALEKKIDRGPDYMPSQPGIPRVLAKLKAKQPVTIVTMGDSLTDKRHWANREKVWCEVLVKKLKDAYGGEITWVNPSIGGTTLSQNIILVPRWLQDAPQPDLVTIWFGGNDWETGVRGPRFKQYMRAAVDRVRRLTKGQADILIMTTCPGFKNWPGYDELCQAAYAVAQEKKTGFADPAGAYQKVGTREEALKRQYWVWDNVHLGPGGHDLVAENVHKAIQSEGLADLRTAQDAVWMKVPMGAEGEVPLSSFEPGQEGIVGSPNGKVAKEHATHGQQAMRTQSTEKDYTPALTLEDGRTLRPLQQNSRFLVDVFNPQDSDVTINVLVKDPQSKDYNTRYNGSIAVKPGKSIIDFDYTHLPRTGTEKSDKPDCLDAKQLTLFVLFFNPHGSGKPVTLFFDNVRLAEKPKDQAKPTATPGDQALDKPVAAPQAAPKAVGVELLAGFEPGVRDLVGGDGKTVSEHATQGEHAFKVESDGKNYLGLRIVEGAPLRKFKDYVLLKVDVFNPQTQPVVMTARIDDATSKDYGSRFNDDNVVAAPGKSTLEFNLTGLTKSNARNFAERQKLDVATARMMTLCIAPVGKPLTLFFR
jgi:lysophospholipase L1-like esterase